MIRLTREAPLEERISDVTTRVRPEEGAPAISDVARHHVVSGLSFGPRADRLSGHRDRYGAAGSAIGRRGERSNARAHPRSTRVCAGGGWDFEHPKAHTAPCDSGTVA